MSPKVLVIGTKNKDKLRELRAMVKGLGVPVLSLTDLPFCRDVVEDGKTFTANAEKKARQYSKRARCLTLADDSGLMVQGLGGKPGVYSARFAGQNCTYRDNNRKLLGMLADKKSSRRAKRMCKKFYNKARHKPEKLRKPLCRKLRKKWGWRRLL